MKTARAKFAVLTGTLAAAIVAAAPSAGASEIGAARIQLAADVLPGTRPERYGAAPSERRHERREYHRRGPVYRGEGVILQPWLHHYVYRPYYSDGGMIEPPPYPIFGGVPHCFWAEGELYWDGYRGVRSRVPVCN